MEFLLNHKNSIISFYQLLKFSLIFIFIPHLLACGFFMLDYFFYSHPNAYPYLNNNMVWLVDSTCLPGVNMI